jgi:dienelactone hydrolase
MTPSSHSLPRRVRHALGPMLLLLAISLSGPACTAQALERDTQGRIEFASFTPPSLFDLARERRAQWLAQTVWGELSLPAGAAGDRVPAMVLMHGSGGIERGMAQWVEAFNGIGVATFVVSSFEPRGVKRTAEDQALVPPAANLMDGLQALQLLATHPRIDAARIGVMGFSRGGEVAFRSAVEPLRRAVIKSELKFALHIPVYAGCNQVYWSPQLTKAPLLNLVGEADDYTGAAACEQLAQRYAEAGATVRTLKYANAPHAWDASYAPLWLPSASSGIGCGVVRWDIDSWTITSEQSGQVIAPARLAEFFTGCLRRGAHVGRNEQAFRQSRQDALAFARKVFVGTGG